MNDPLLAATPTAGVLEPVRSRVHREMLARLDLPQLEKMSAESLRAELQWLAGQIMDEFRIALNESERRQVIQGIQDEMLGLGPLEPLLADPGISDILVNGPQQTWIERRGKLERSAVRFDDDAHLRRVIDRIVSRIGRDFGLEAMAHLTCVNATVEELHETLGQMRDAGIDNVLALRGDPPHGQERWTKTEGGLEYSIELIELLRRDYAFSIGGAAFPETHIHATSPEDDVRFLKAKVDAGAQFLITQMFFDNRYYFDFVERARAAGIDVPIIPGVMPILSRSGIRRMAELSKARLPDGLQRVLEVRDDHEAIAEFGVSYATLQCAELLAAGAPGIHFVTLNRSPATRAILTSLKLMRPWDATRTALEEDSLALG